MTCNERTLADDLLQETYLRMLRRTLPPLDERQLKGYLYSTARSVVADHYRARKRESRWSETRSLPDVNDGNGVGYGGEHRVSGPCELPLDMQRTFAALSPRQQELLWLAYVEGFSHDEIAGIVGVAVASVKVLLSRARAELASKLRDRGLAPVASEGRSR